MRILTVHNYYQQPGGEDQVFAAEKHLLQHFGHQVDTFTVHNDDVDSLSRARLAARTVWARSAAREIARRVRAGNTGIAHFHNTLPLVSPAAYGAARAAGAAVVQTLHNYRLLCPQALLYRENRVCEDCVPHRMKLSAVQHRCYRGSAAASSAVAVMIAAHGLLGTWEHDVDVYVALTAFGRDKAIEGGLPAHKVVVKPHFVAHDPGVGHANGRYALFVGRLSQEKGLATLLAAWKHLAPPFPLKIAGDGPLADEILRWRDGASHIELLGRRPHHEVLDLMKGASFLVFPSECYETFGLAIIEAMACGTPVIAADHGSMATLVDHERSGLRFPPGQPERLAEQVTWMLDHPKRLAEMRREARAEYETRYTAEQNYGLLMQIYERAIASRRHA